jgi:uncharacterized membrane protein
MVNPHVIVGVGETPARPVVRKIGLADLNDALAKGIADFWAMPTHVLYLGILYPVVGLILSRVIFGYDLMSLLFPLAAGFALIGPFAALGLYELNRRREQSLDISRTHIFDVLRTPSRDAILALGSAESRGSWKGSRHRLAVALRVVGSLRSPFHTEMRSPS